MDGRELLNALTVAERLKDTTRHCYTSGGRHESVAEHSWRLALMAYWVSDEFPELDMNKVIKMCLIHDLGEAFTGDIAAFNKTEDDARKELEIYQEWIHQLPEYQKKQMSALLEEMEELKTKEAKLYKALDKMEAVIQHDESDIASWLPLEYDLQLTYGSKEVAFSPYLMELKKLIDEWTRDKIAKGK